jgi:3-dehydroquinate dehydratase/shikimate dehydrogenase
MISRIAASLALPDTDSCLAALVDLAPWIGMAEVCMDRMDSVDLERLIRLAPCPLIISCRPPREGGRFPGSETERIDLLWQAATLGCEYIDLEWDSVELLPRHTLGKTKLILSRHWMDDMPASFQSEYETLRGRADVVKVAGLARRPADMLPIFDFLLRAASPVIGVAMGEDGQLTRVLAPCFPNCLLTYGALSSSTATASGQLSLYDMIHRHGLHRIEPSTPLHLHVCSGDPPEDGTGRHNQGAADGERRITVRLPPTDLPDVLAALRVCLPLVRVTVDEALTAALAGTRAATWQRAGHGW